MERDPVLKAEAIFGDPKAILLSLSGMHYLPDLLPLAVRKLANSPRIALARIWLNRPPETGDCGACELSDECLSRSKCLHLAASYGHSLLDESEHWERLDGAFRRFPLGVRKVGHIGKTGSPIRIDVSQESSWIADPVWVQEEQVAAFQGMPLIYRDQVLGVLGIFSREPIGHSCEQWLEMISSHLAAAISNAVSVDEIACLKNKLEQENEYLREEIGTTAFGELVGQSAALQAIVEQIDLVAPTDSSVLVLGESGTGKELIAREVHRRSQRSERPLIKVNCAAIPRELYESEFFGHSKGAFTGALRDRAGRFELADGGTLFLDEIGEIPLDLQSKLLRVLQENELERVGEEKTRKVDVRIIAATNRDLRQEAIEGRFRQDLFYRLSVFPIELAPLRDRIEDIPLLAKHFLQAFARKFGRHSFRLSMANVQTLQSYQWPGNIRELQHVLERAAIVSTNGKLSINLPNNEPLDSNLRPHLQTIASSPGSVEEPNIEQRVLNESAMIQLQIDNIRRALSATGGKIYGKDGAAQLLGVKATTLASRMKKFGITDFGA